MAGWNWFGSDPNLNYGSNPNFNYGSNPNLNYGKNSTLASRQMDTGATTPAQQGMNRGWEYGMSIIFYKEIMENYRKMRSEVPVYDCGYITNILSPNTYKVKLNGLGSEVTAKSSEASWSHKNAYLIGALCLVLVDNSQYTIIAVRQTGVFAPVVPEQPV